MRSIATACVLLSFAACSDHTGSILAPDSNPPPPMSQPNGHVADNHPTFGAQPGNGSGGATQPGGGGTGGGGGAPVPEPGTLLLVGTGLAGLALWGRRRKTAANSGMV